MKTFAAIFALAATPAMAHPGHVLAASGHDHWSLLAGLAVIAVALTLALIRRT